MDRKFSFYIPLVPFWLDHKRDKLGKLMTNEGIK